MVPLARYYRGLLIAAACVALAPLPAWPQTVSSYSESVDIQADGAARVVVDVLVPAGIRSIRLPVAEGARDAQTVSPAADASGVLAVHAGRAYLDLSIPSAVGDAHVRIVYRVDPWPGVKAPILTHDNRRIVYGITNTTTEQLPIVDASILLPPGLDVAAVEGVEPAVAEAATMLPYVLERRQGRAAVRLGPRTLAPGERVRVTMKAGHRSGTIEVVATVTLLAGAYLVAFRQLIQRRGATTD